MVAKLFIAFPKMDTGFWDLLSERIVANGFTKERLKNAVEYVLDNFAYKELNISDIIRFDKRVKLYTFNELYKIEGQVPHPDYEKRIINEKVFYVKKNDLI